MTNTTTYKKGEEIEKRDKLTTRINTGIIIFCIIMLIILEFKSH